MQRRDTAALTAAAGLALSFAPTLMRRPRRAQLALSAASIGLGGLAGTATELLVMRLARELDGGQVAARRLLVGAGAASILTELPESPHAAVALAGQSARLAGICALIGAVAPEHEVVPLERPRTLIALCAAGAAAVVGWQQLDRRLRPRRPGWRRSRPSTRSQPSRRSAAASRARASSAPRPTGWRATRCACSWAWTPRRRWPTGARLAVDELERLGGFDRRRIVVCSPTLRGYVNPIPLAAEECLAGGDVASVTVQYHDRRTLLMPLKVPIAARTHRAVLEELRGRAPEGAEICVFGESLGAWASQNVFRGGGVRALDEARVARALWIGTPYFSRLPRLLASGAIPADARVSSVAVADLREGDVERDGRFVFVARRTDPVVLFRGLDLIWRRAGLAAPPHVDAGHHVPAAGLRPDRGDELAVDDAAGAGPRLPAGGAARGGPRVRPSRVARAALRAGRPARRGRGRARREDPSTAARGQLYSRALITRSQTVWPPA